MSIVIPGDRIAALKGTLDPTIGPGIHRYPLRDIIPLLSGYLNVVSASGETVVYVEANSKRYIPQVNDFVVGIITGVYAENFKVSLQKFSPSVSLSTLAFPNARKRNKPNLKVGQVVYSRVSVAGPDLETEIQCMDPETGKDGGFGPLDEEGYVFEVEQNFARELLFNKSFPALEKLAAVCAFEIAIGMNGLIWIKCGSGLTTGKEGTEDVDMLNPIQDLKRTLAAAEYLKACQKVPQSEFDNQIKAVFRDTL